MKNLPIYALSLLVGTAAFGAVTITETNDEPPLQAPRPPVAPHPPRGPLPPREPKGELGSREEFNLKQLQLNALQMAENAQAAAASILGGSNSKQPLFIATTAPAPETTAAVMEDMTVMARILQKANSADERDARAMGIFVRLPGQPAARNMYIDGQGALFFLHVNFPLLPAKPSVEAEAPAAPPSEWDETKKELAEPERADNSPFPLPHASVGGAAEFHQEQVDELQARLTMALTNAVHIRALKPEETVTVVVTGNSGETVRKLPSRKLRVPSAPRAGSSPEPKAEPQMVLRVKRKDIETFLASKDAPETFRKSVLSLVY